MSRIFLAVLAALVLGHLAPSPAAARVVERREYGNWVYEYNVSNQVASCVASRYYSNAQFSVRLYGDMMDVLFWRNDFRWPWDRAMGDAVVTVSGNRYRLEASTPRRGDGARSALLILNLRPRDYGAFFRDLQRARKLRIDLWNGKAYPVDLTGSRRAMDTAWDCWRRRDTGS